MTCVLPTFYRAGSHEWSILSYPGSANRLIVARHNGKRVQLPSIPEPLLRAAHAVCHVTFRMDGAHPEFSTGEIDYRLRHRKRKIARQRRRGIFTRSGMP